uniref:nucleotidyltransferase family protein n=1 Tax=Lachnoclostridium phocaeense TaxID=1871021 RepID=UPI0026DA84B2|nr:sugar phosphate nucleotidyltransferase [Lachnoclostridium phocaeense]
MGNATLVIMAAGIGSRFGGGIKQLEPVGPNGEIIMDYSIYDALEAGFDKVVFVIRKDLEKDFKEIIGKRIEKQVETAYAFQELDDIPEEYKDKFQGRTKPWGTGQAILCCKDLVHEPFLVINADDYYGKQAYKEAYSYLQEMKRDPHSDKLPVCMVGFVLKNTLSDNGGVTRGICRVDEFHMLTDIVETHNIVKTQEGAAVQKEDRREKIDVESEVSMNMWGLTPDFFEILDDGFDKFLSEIAMEDVKAEYLLPTIIGDLLKANQVEVKVLQSKDRWFGVTYKEDKDVVVNSIKELIDQGDYQKKGD